ncbi:DUF2087 domain-containing protein [Arcanobacterium bovis]|uniref:DUF2087 domain-containing protein n=1 Tax=Arcanobacterium bovis TaxID=2529275 RepID=A0A4Q9UZC7_9ACTO|nr:DUF2087 domain-containing protein [Arcanobacterium bovis]
MVLINYFLPAGTVVVSHLEYLALRLFSQSDNLQESQVNERLKVVTDDFATLRRYLIDAGLLERLNDGTSYRLSHSIAAAQTL